MAVCIQEACLELLDRSGKTKYRRWYKSFQVARVVRYRLQETLQKSGDTWVIWTFEQPTNEQVLLWSSRPLGWRFVPAV